MSYTSNPLAILPGAGITITPSTGVGAQSITISAGNTQVVVVRTANTTPVTLTNTDDVVVVQVPGSVSVAANLPAGVLGRVFNIKDGLGLASAAAPITITPAAGTIDNSNTAIINVPFGSISLVYNGTQWNIL